MRSVSFGILSFTILILFSACESTEQKEERLARQYCSSCHAFPEPALLTKVIWEKKVMPQMAFRMGFEDMALTMKMTNEDRMIVMNSLPAEPMLTEEEFDMIKNYYARKSPDSLPSVPVMAAENLDQFEISQFRLPVNAPPLTTLVKADTLHQKIYVGNRLSKLYQFNFALALEDSFQLQSPASDMIMNDSVMLLSLMGYMDPNDQSQGEVITLTSNARSGVVILDSLQRPVHLQKVDLNGDHLEDYVICAFGNYTGALLAFENLGHKKYKRHVLLSSPGARKVEVGDFDKNGMTDIIVLMTQGDERIVLLSNKGNFDFRLTVLLRFPPVYGSSYFELVDFNHDGKSDILYTNGDNADYSPILKPYHGVRIFLNDGTNQFKEHWFHPLHGASQAHARDYDHDGDIDVAAISFFPDFTTHPEHGFVYFENTGNGFKARTTTLASSGRWITLEAEDIDSDGDCDLLLGALNFESGVPRPILEQWSHEKTSLLILRNTLH